MHVESFKKTMGRESFEKIVRLHADDEIIEVRPIENKGTVNEVYILIGKFSKYVLRVDPHETTTERFQKEKWCTEVAERLGVLGPAMFELGLEDGHPYTLTSYIDGLHGEEATHADRQLIWKALGQYTRQIHSVKVEGFGLDMASPAIFKDNWTRYLDYNISSLTANDKLISLGLITSKESEILKVAFTELKAAPLNFGLAHGDIALRNTILAPDRRVYVIDWGCARAEVVPHMDFAEIIRTSVSDKSEDFGMFLDGYGMTHEEFRAIKPEILQWQLLSSADTLRWAVDRRPEEIHEKADALKSALMHFEHEQERR